jgi:hypothetical protein
MKNLTRDRPAFIRRNTAAILVCAIVGFVQCVWAASLLSALINPFPDGIPFEDKDFSGQPALFYWSCVWFIVMGVDRSYRTAIVSGYCCCYVDPYDDDQTEVKA